MSSFAAQLLGLISVVWPGLAVASCFNPFYTVTEILNHNDEEYHVFTCEVLATYKLSSGFESIAVVKDRYFGEPTDTIYLFTGGESSAGGEKLSLRSTWLIFSPSTDCRHYRATICDRLSVQLTSGHHECNSQKLSSLGKEVLQLLGEYQKIQQQQYSGFKKFEIGQRLFAEGEFRNGLAHGQWRHYSWPYDSNGKRIKSEISYYQGKWNGPYLVYDEYNDGSVVEEIRSYKLDQLERLEKIARSTVDEYEYIAPNQRRHTFTKLGLDNCPVAFVSYMEINFNSELPYQLKFKHGSFYNLSAQDSSSLFPLGRGDYFYGAKVGEWEFYDKHGNLLYRRTYPPVVTNDSRVAVYDEKNRVVLEGRFVENKFLGIWTQYFNEVIVSQWMFNSQGRRIATYKYYSNGDFEIIPYVSDRISGNVIKMRKDSTVLSIHSYVNGEKHGPAIYYNPDGSIQKEINYFKSRANSQRDTENGYYIDGFLNGYVVSYDAQGEGKMSEGRYWQGYRVGKWINYHRNRVSSIAYYSEDTSKIMNACSGNTPYRLEYYDAKTDQYLIRDY
jgi:antitoxin component YwqK of YwqJK toxin-antitoxin module